MTQTLLDVSLDMSRPYPGTPAERAARGKAARRHSPRSAHAAFTAARDRADPVDLLEGQAQHRVPELVPIRYGRMLASPFTFYRGAALIMAADLAETPRSGFEVQLLRGRPSVELRALRLAGAAAPLRHQRLRRDAARPVGVGRQAPGGEPASSPARDNGLSAKERSASSCALPPSTGARMAAFAGDADARRLVPAVRDRAARAAELAPGRRRQSAQAPDKRIAKARARDSLQAFAKLTETSDGDARIIADPPLIVPRGRP